MISNRHSWTPFEAGVVDKVVKSMALDSAADLSGLRVCHLQLLVKAGFGQAIRDLLVATLRGSLPAAVEQYFWCGRSMPLIKDDHGAIRPITVPSLWSRLLGTIVSDRCKPLAASLEPLQVGVHTASGTETSAALMMTSLLEKPEHVGVCFDMQNAFNSLNRSRLFAAVRELKDPLLLAYTLAGYQSPTECLFRGARPEDSCVIQCTSGVRQGDCLSPLLFALAIHPVLKDLAQPQPPSAPVTDGSHLLNVATPTTVDVVSGYLDDIMIVAHPTVAQRLVATGLQERLNAHNTGLVIVDRKTKAYSPGLDLTTHAQVWKCTVQPPSQGLVVLGVPVGTPEFIRDHVATVVNGLAPVLDDICALPLQHAQLVLRYCITSKINNLLRACPTQLITPVARRFDDLVWNTISRLLDVPADAEDLGFDLPRARAVLSLPLRMGGCGLAPATVVAPGAFLAGVSAVHASLERLFPRWAGVFRKWASTDLPSNCAIDPSLYRGSVLDGLQLVKERQRENEEELGRPQVPDKFKAKWYPTTFDELLTKASGAQKNLTLLFQSVEQGRLFFKLGDHQKASLLSRCSPRALDFLHAVPSSPTLFIEDETMRYGLRRLAFLPVANRELPRARYPTATETSASNDLDILCRAVLRDKASCSAYDRHTNSIQQITRMLRAGRLPLRS